MPTFRTQLEIILYSLASQHLDEAKNARHRGTDGNQNELESSMVTIILAATCLESFINSIGMELPGNEWGEYTSGKSRINGRRPRLSDKWYELTEKRTQGTTFDKGVKPFQDVVKLIDLRNYIVHYDAPSGPPQNSPTGYVTEARAKINYESARDSVSTMTNMLIVFHRLCGVETPYWIG